MKRQQISYDSIVEDIKQCVQTFQEYDCIVGIARGGVIPATLFAYQLNLKDIYITQLSSYDKDNKHTTLFEKVPLNISDILNKKVLFVDDISDTGQTLNYIKQTYSKYTMDSKFYTCIYKVKSIFKPDYYGKIVNEDTWLDFPWE